MILVQNFLLLLDGGVSTECDETIAEKLACSWVRVNGLDAVTESCGRARVFSHTMHLNIVSPLEQLVRDFGGCP